MKKIYHIAGEPSGDLHTANLLKELKKIAPTELQFRGMGGDRIAEVTGVQPTVHIRETDFMGFWEVIKNLPHIRKIMKTIKKDIKNFQPDALILTDYPGFNIRIAKFAKELNIPVYYYISPQVWAWKKGRVKTLKKVTNLMMCILPFEKDFYRKEGMEVEYVGHPLPDYIDSYDFNPSFKSQYSPEKDLIALLPGSRTQEIKIMLPVMKEVAKRFPEYQFIIAGAPGRNEDFYKKILENSSIPVLFNQTYDVIKNAKAALVTSGTATLETALIGTPQAVCYKGGWVSYQIAKRLVKLKYISLVNLIADRPVIRELIQNELNVENVSDELHQICMDAIRRENILRDYVELKKSLSGGASQKAAILIAQKMQILS